MVLPIKIIAVIALLGILIFVHELGHFLVAKAFRIKVVRFSLGFGPKLFGFTRGETEYQVSLLPLGGYVKMAGDDPNEEVAPADRGRGYLEQAPWKRMLVAFAGPAFNLVFPLIVYFLVFAGQREGIAPYVGWILPGMPAQVAGLQVGDTITAVDGEKVHSFEDLVRSVTPRPGEPLSVEVLRDGKALSLMMTPEPEIEKNAIETRTIGRIGISPWPSRPFVGVSNPSIAGEAGLRPLDRIASVDGESVETFEQAHKALESAIREGRTSKVVAVRSRPVRVGLFELGLPEAVETSLTPIAGVPLGIEPIDAYISRIAPGSPAARAGLVRGDKVTAVGDTPVFAWEDVERAQRAAKGEAIELTVARGGLEAQFSVTPQTRKLDDEITGKSVTHYVFGAFGGRRPVAKPPTSVLPLRPIVALERAAYETGATIRKVALAFGLLFTGGIAAKNIGGPLQIFDVASQAAAAGWEYYLGTMALISVNLGLLNLLPVPVLDGGHILQATIETVRRKPLSLRAREISQLVGLVLLVALMVFALHNDVMRYLLS